MSQPTNGRRVRLALVGLGGHGSTIQGAAQAAPSVEVVAVYDPNRDEAARAAERFGCEAAESYEALLERDGIDAVSLCSPNFVHREQAEAAFEAGLDVFVEKPIANTIADGRAMRQAAERSGRILMVAHNQRYGPALRWAREIIASGRVGTLVSAEFHYSSDTALRLTSSSWRLRPEQCPLLPMMQLGIHAVDLVHYLLGPIVRVSATARTISTPPGVPDSVLAHFETAAGAAGDSVHGVILSNYCTPVRFSYRLSGTLGALEGTPAEASFTPRSGTDGRPEYCDGGGDGFASYAEQMEHFAQSVLVRSAPETGATEGIAALAVVEAMTQSIATGQSVDVNALLSEDKPEVL